MKYGSHKAAFFALCACFTIFSIQADEKTVNLESRILESFDGDSGYSWRTTGSKFSTKTDEEEFPKISMVPVWPAALFGSNRENADLKSLGIWGRFDRKGYNWIDIVPYAADAAEDDPPAEIQIPGRVSMIDMWIWGSNFNYYVEAYLRDYKGVVHLLPVGDLTFEGWKNLRINIPESIPQAKPTLPRLQSLSLVKFRVWTRPMERVDNFQVYFDHLKVLTDTFETMFDGDELADPERVQELWNADSGR